LEQWGKKGKEATFLKKQVNRGCTRNKENGYPVPDPNKMINDTKVSSDTHIKTLKKVILEESTETFMERILDMVNQKVQDALKKFQDTKNKEHEKTQEQMNREDFNRHQSEAKDTIKREIYELKLTT
jgi:anthranilate/para-aminobenzoate synthase component I